MNLPNEVLYKNHVYYSFNRKLLNRPFPPTPRDDIEGCFTQFFNEIMISDLF
jgi:hypothetical protein